MNMGAKQERITRKDLVFDSVGDIGGDDVQEDAID